MTSPYAADPCENCGAVPAPRSSTNGDALCDLCWNALPAEDDIPAAPRSPDEDYCAGGGHGYYGDDAGVGRCYCGKQTYPAGGPDAAPTSGLTSPCDADPASSP